MYFIGQQQEKDLRKIRNNKRHPEGCFFVKKTCNSHTFCYIIICYIVCMGLQLSWLEQPAHNRSVLGSSPSRPTKNICGCNSIGQSSCLPSRLLRVRVSSPAPFKKMPSKRYFFITKILKICSIFYNQKLIRNNKQTLVPEYSGIVCSTRY